MYIYIYIYTHTCIYEHINTYINIYVEYIYIYIHTHTIYKKIYFKELAHEIMRAGKSVICRAGWQLRQDFC